MCEYPLDFGYLKRFISMDVNLVAGVKRLRSSHYLTVLYTRSLFVNRHKKKSNKDKIARQGHGILEIKREITDDTTARYCVQHTL